MQPFLSFADIALSHEYLPGFIPSTVAGALEAYDLADLMAALNPRKLLIINPLSANGTLLDEVRAGEKLAFPVNVYSHKGRGEDFSFILRKEDQPLFEELLIWLNKN